jgi:hypothetical protein
MRRWLGNANATVVIPGRSGAEGLQSTVPPKQSISAVDGQSNFASCGYDADPLGLLIGSARPGLWSGEYLILRVYNGTVLGAGIP